MGSLGDGVKKVLLAGIGTAAVTAEKSMFLSGHLHRKNWTSCLTR